jgi:putative YhbY family RNA-binding protein
MQTLTPAERRAFRAKAHALHPVVTIGHHGLTPAVLHEIDVALLAHELIKIRVFSNARDERAALLARICTELSAAPVQHLGKVLIIWRPAPEAEQAEQPARQKRKTRAPARTPAAAASGPTPDEPRTRRQWVRPGTVAAPRSGAPKSRNADASARRRRPSDVVGGAAPSKRRAVTAGKAADNRKRAPPTTKGPFEPGKRSQRTKVSTGKDSQSATTTRRRRRQI